MDTLKPEFLFVVVVVFKWAGLYQRPLWGFDSTFVQRSKRVLTCQFTSAKPLLPFLG